jgi:hypothetical protein
MSTAAKPLLDRAAILGADDREYELVDVPQWGGTVRVRALSGTDRDRYLQSLYEVADDGSGNFKVSSGASTARRSDWSRCRSLTRKASPSSAMRMSRPSPRRTAPPSDGSTRSPLACRAYRRAREEAKRDLKAARNGSSGSA